MKNLNRRQFIKLCAASGAAVGLSQLWIPELAEAFGGEDKGKAPIIWIQASACGGCTNSLINSVNPGMKQILSEIIDLSFHPGLASGGAPWDIARKHQGRFILVVEGSIPKANNGAFNSIGQDANGKEFALIDLVKNLSSMAGTVVAIGSCASYGGISSAEPNEPYCVGVENIVPPGKVVNIPGCPPHPDWIMGTLGHILLFGKPDLDDFGRPKLFYEGLIHNNCPLRQHYDNSIFARKIGDKGCMLLLGCKGPVTFGDCSTRLWNGASSWCVSSNSPCIGCTSPDFPEQTMPFYQKVPEVKVPGISATPDQIGIGLGVATAAGIAVHLAGTVFSGRLTGHKQKKEGGQ